MASALELSGLRSKRQFSSKTDWAFIAASKSAGAYWRLFSLKWGNADLWTLSRSTQRYNLMGLSLHLSWSPGRRRYVASVQLFIPLAQPLFTFVFFTSHMDRVISQKTFSSPCCDAKLLFPEWERHTVIQPQQCPTSSHVCGLCSTFHLVCPECKARGGAGLIIR